MSMIFGSDSLDALYFGTDPIDAVYIGSDQVYPSFILDDFNRANTTPTNAAGIGLGAGWNAPGWKISSNRAQKDGGQDDAIFLTDTGSFDHFVEMEIVGTIGVQNPAYTVVHARVNEASGLAQNAVIGYVDPGGLKRATIARYQSGGFVEIAFGMNGLDISGTYTLRLECEGNDARLYHNGVLTCTTDISALTNLGNYTGMAAQNASPPVDNFKCGRL